MSQHHLASLHEKLKTSPYWRDDFKIEEMKQHDGIVVYYISANDDEPSTHLAIAKLNEILNPRT